MADRSESEAIPEMIIPRKIAGDCREGLKQVAENSVHCCITSIPYWGLRSYLPKGHPLKPLEIGCEPTFELYLEHILEVFGAVHRVMRHDGTLWVNVGDAYVSVGGHADKHCDDRRGQYQIDRRQDSKRARSASGHGLKAKDLMMMPARVAMAIQAQGWYLRAMCPWIKRNCLSGGAWVYVRSQKGEMPMMVKDLARLRIGTVDLWNGEKWTRLVDMHRTTKGDTQIEIELRSGERIGCTPEHRWPTERGLLHARDLMVGDILKRCRLPQPTPPAQPSRLPDELIGWLCGIYLAEGFITEGHVALCGHSKETPSRMLNLIDLVHSLHGTMWASKQGGNAETLHIYCPALCAIVQDYIWGHSAKNKAVGTKCWQRSDVFLIGLLMGYLEGDGCRDKKNPGRWKIGFCNNDSLARDLRVLCARLGMEIRMRRGKVTVEKGGRFHKIWRGEIRISRPEKSVIPGTFERTSDCEIIAIRKSRARQFFDIGVKDEPHLFALASGVLTHNSMPESVTDRPATATEYVFLLSKSPKYFYDRYAVMMGTSDKTHPRRARNRRNTDWFMESWQGMMTDEGGEPIAFVVNPKGTKIAHFATFPPKLVEPMVKASTSERGCCAVCGAPWERVLHPSERYQAILGKSYHPHLDDETLGMRGCRGGNMQNKMRDSGIAGAEFESKGWQPTCECNGTLTRGKVTIPARMSKEDVSEWGADKNGEYHGKNQKNYQQHLAEPASTVKARIIRNATQDREVDGWIYKSELPLEKHTVVPCTVLDPFGGISTTAGVSTDLGRHSIMCELNPEYSEMGRMRDGQAGLVLL